jgi:glycosyltransferase involved in cell wall biosynthesis
MLPKISIITPSYNQGRFIEETILSVLNQGYPNLEYVIIDGGSTDGTVDAIRRYEEHLAYWVSEKDRGQVHAINKGLRRVTGEIVAFINSDDVYLSGALSAVAAHFSERPGCQWVCGDTLMFGNGHATSLIRAVVPRSAAHCLSWSYKAPQPGHFWRRELIQTLGFDEQWPYDFDHDLYVRLLLAGHKCEYLPLPLAGYRLHSASKTVAENHRQIAEFDRSAEVYERQLHGADRRWCRATRFLRCSYAASDAGNKKESARWLTRALIAYPEGLAGREFWGCLHRLVANDSRTSGGSE